MASSHPKHAQPDRAILPVIAERWSPYAYDPRPVEREKLLTCLEALRWAPSSYNEQPWTYILAERGDAAAFAQLLDCLVEGNQAWAKNAGVLMISVVSRLFTKNGKPNKAAEHDLGLAAGNFVLQATALGLQGHQMIGIEPAKVLGYPAPLQPGTTDPLAQRDLVPRTRKPLSEIVMTTWGQPAEL